MRTMDDLADDAAGLDGRGYKAYKALAGSYAGAGYLFHVDHVQGDPFAEPSRVRLVVPAERTRLPDWSRGTAAQRVSTADFFNRILSRRMRAVTRRVGTGRSGELHILRPGQEVLERTSVVVRADGELEARFTVGLPADGRRILGKAAARIFREDIPTVVTQAMVAAAVDLEELRQHVEVVTDAQALRAQLADRNLVAFVANGSILPRASGVDDRPLAIGKAQVFEAPPDLSVTLEAPHAGPTTGMGVPTGVTLIVGGGFHGKSTLLRAIERGVYEHVPGDGRERVVAVADAVKVRAEDGRRIAGTDISGFIDRLPGGEDTTHFETDNASGSTSQAAAIAEAIEVGSCCLLMDEDTSATNLMIRDARMQALIPEEMEPITPFVDRAGQLWRDAGISTLLVVGGSGDYFDVADTVIAMQRYEPKNVTDAARRIAGERPSQRDAASKPWQAPGARVPRPESVDARKGRRSVNIKIPTDDRLVFGTQEVRLGAVEQIVEVAQIQAIAEALAWARGSAIDGRRDFRSALTALVDRISADGLETVQERLTGKLAAFRIFELAAVLNRMRSLSVD